MSTAPTAASDGSQPRPLDSLGPPANPVEFPRPRLMRGRRDKVLCYNASTDTHEVVENVLFRDFARGDLSAPLYDHGGHNNTSASKANRNKQDQRRRAYWKLPYKENIQTIMGHVEICRVLVRCLPQRDSDDEGHTDDDNDDDDDDFDEDDIVFEWTDEMVAVKVNYADRMDRLRTKHAENPLQEIAAMQLLGEDPVRVLGAMEVLFDGQNLNLVMRYCNSGDLFQLLQDNQNRPGSETPGLVEGEARFWFRQVVEGVSFLHSRGVCHRDLSPENIMIHGTESLIIDMGMCLRVPYVNPSGEGTTDIEGSKGETRCLIKPQGPCGKLPYMSPEIYANRRPFDGAAADIWTSGTILFCMITGNRSYQRPHSSDPQFYWMSQGLRQLLSDWQVKMTEEGQQLLEGMLQIDPRKRLTLEEIRNHPWFDFPDEPPLVEEEQMELQLD